MKFSNILISLILMLGISTGATASSQASSTPNFEPDKVADFAKKVEKQLAAKGARVFILARVGRPESELPSGIKYTHTAIGVYSKIQTDDGRVIPGYSIYNLYQREDRKDISDLIVDYPIDFFMGVHELRAGIIIPTPELQRRLLSVISSNTYKALHNSNYSVIANPFNTTFQNCTEHTLDVINAAIYGTSDRKKLKAAAREHFQPQEITINPFKLLIGSMFTEDVATRDHLDDAIETTTFTTIAKYLHQNDLVDEQFVVIAD